MLHNPRMWFGFWLLWTVVLAALMVLEAARGNWLWLGYLLLIVMVVYCAADAWRWWRAEQS